MKRILLLLISVFLSIAVQGQNNFICRSGFSYDISQSANWGNGLPVVTQVIPYSSAELAGLKYADIIESIDAVPTAGLTEDELRQLINPIDKYEIVLAVRSTGNSSRELRIRKECKLSNTITEDQLAIAFNMYSLETTVERKFVCPFKITVTSDPVDFATFRTYDFSSLDQNNIALENTINESIEKELMEKGMVQNTEKPDVLIQTYYYFDRNTNYKGPNPLIVDKEPLFRYDKAYNRMVQVPFLNYQTAESEAEYLLQFGFRIIDRRDIPGRILWECEANELLVNSYRLEDYARIHIPLMCMQYPYVKYTRNVPYAISKKSYNYTGIQYDIDRLELIVEVDRNSPAYAAGIRAGDIVERIGRHRMDRTSEDFTAAYRRFILNTMDFRDSKTRFTDANGFPHCMHWDTFKYTQIASALQKSNAQAPFSYLYFFTPYVNPSGNNACVFLIRRGKEKIEVTIRPTIRTDATIDIK
ncbi:MAG: DUF4136 domain-containing protein [Tannerellaceae bacterium]|jgi:hypothetical protein|nr:DUF4136 domain-containing protein [Tannerellaceae bacterium]